MLPLNILLLVLPLALAAPAPAANPAPVPTPIKPIFGSWGESVKPFKSGHIGDKYNPAGAAQNLSPPPPPPSAPRPQPPPPAAPKSEPQPESEGRKQAKESSSYSDVTRMGASNSVALFNGVPVDPLTGQPINPPEIKDNENKETLYKRGLLKKKLGLDFLDDPNLDETIVREHLKSPQIGMGLASPKGQQPQPMDASQSASVAATAGAADGPAPLTPQQPSPKPDEKRSWNGNAYMVVNGVPMAVDGDVTGKALDISMFAPKKGALQKRGDIRGKLGLGMFDMPGVSSRRKTITPTPEASAEDEAEAEFEAMVEAEEGEAVKVEAMQAPAPDYQPHYQNGDIEELTVKDLGKSFVIYNGMPVEINGAPVRNKKLKKPRPAFPGGCDNQMVKRGATPGRKYPNLAPFKSNPITGGYKANGVNGVNNGNNKARDGTKGRTNSDTTRGEEHTSQSPHTSEEEFVRINKGASTCLFNGRPVDMGGRSIFDGMRE